MNEYTNKLKNLLDDPSTFDINIDYNMIREIILEVTNQTDETRKGLSSFENLEKKFLKTSDLRPIQDTVDGLKGKIDMQAQDFSSELKEIRAYYSYQLKELHSKIESNVSAVIESISKPISPIPTPTTNEGGQMQFSDDTLRADLELLKERFEALLNSLTRPDTAREEEESVEKPDEKPTPPIKDPIPEPIPSKPEPAPIKTEVILPHENTPLKLIHESDSYGVSTPQFVQNKVITPKTNNKFLEMRVDDMFIQIKTLQDNIKKVDELFSPVSQIPQLKSDVEFLSSEINKIRTETMLNKAEIQRVSDTNAGKLASFVKELNSSSDDHAYSGIGISNEEHEQTLKQLRVQLFQQMAQIENGILEEVKKLKSEISILRTSQTLNNNEQKSDEIQIIVSEPLNIHYEYHEPEPDNEPIKIMNNEILLIKDAIKQNEKVLADYIEKISRKNEIFVSSNSVTIQINQDEYEEPIQERSIVSLIPTKIEFSDCESNTDAYQPDISYVCSSVQSINVPNQFYSSLIIQAPPIVFDNSISIQAPLITIPEQIDQGSQFHSLSLAETTSINVSLVDNLSELKAELNQHKQILHQVLLNSGTVSETVSKEILALPFSNEENDKKFEELTVISDSLKNKAQKLQYLLNVHDNDIQQIQSDIAKVNENYSQIVDKIKTIDSKPPTNQIIHVNTPSINHEAQNHQIILSPVMFSELNILPYPLHVIPYNSPEKIEKASQVRERKPRIKKENKKPKNSETDKNPKREDLSNVVKPTEEVEIEKETSPIIEPPKPAPIPKIEIPQHSTSGNEEDSPISDHSIFISEPMNHLQSNREEENQAETEIVHDEEKPPKIDEQKIRVSFDIDPKKQNEPNITVLTTPPITEITNKPSLNEEAEEDHPSETVIEEENLVLSLESSQIFESTEEFSDSTILSAVKQQVISLQDQVQLLRSVYSEMRSKIQELSIQQKNTDDILSKPIIPATSPSPSGTDENAVRALRRRIDTNFREVEKEVYDIRKEIMEIRQQVSVIAHSKEKVVEVHIPQMSKIPDIRPVSIEQSDKKIVIENDPKKNLSSTQISPRLLKVTSLKLPDLPIESNGNKEPLIDSINSSVPKLKPTPNGSRSPSPDNTSSIPSPSIMNSRITKDVLPSAPATPDGSFRPIFHNVVKQQIDELKILNANDRIDEEVVELLINVRTQLQLQIDQNASRLHSIESKMDNVVDKEYIGKFFSKIRLMVSDSASSIDLIKQQLPDKVSFEELQSSMEELYGLLTKEESTSGGVSSYKCLLCGRPKSQISGMITDKVVVEALGEPQLATVNSTSQIGARGSLLYGPDKHLYKGRGNFGRPTTSTIQEKRPLPSI